VLHLVLTTGSNPKIVNYNACTVKIYNAMGRTVRFEKKSILKNGLAYYNAGAVVVNSKVEGEAPETDNRVSLSPYLV
jgi:hypothetical protein